MVRINTEKSKNVYLQTALKATSLLCSRLKKQTPPAIGSLYETQKYKEAHQGKTQGRKAVTALQSLALTLTLH